MAAPGLYKCDVMDTKTFQDNGLIQIRVHGIDPLDVTENAEVMTPFGGLPNMGIQALPPIGSIGYVLFQQQDDRFPIFVGSLLVAGQNSDGDSQQIVEAPNPEDLVLKTQHTTFDDRDVTSDDNKIENIIRMNKDELLLAKVNQGDDYSYDTESYSIDDKTYNIIKLSDETITIKYKISGSDDYSSILLNEDGVKIEMSSDGNSNTMVVNSDGVTLDANGKATVTLNASDGSATITADKVILGGDDDDAVKFSAIRDFVNQGFNSHTHGSPSGPTSPPVAPFTSIGSAKASKVRLS